ncbi:MAG: lysophospholipid acyltransferase family protein [Cellvibrionales bacterium]|nr:lysophospholipid acyltransferase family protein [Cellvibrionales bacterium]
MKKSDRSALLTWLIKLLATVPEPIWHKCVVPIATELLWHLKSEFRRITEINVSLCYPDLNERQKQQLAKDSIRETLKTFFEFPYVLTQSSEKSLKKVTQVDGQHYVDQAEAEGCGIIFLSPHLGNWEFLGLKVGQDYDLTSLFKPGRIQTINELLHSAREGSGAHLVPTNKKGVLALFKALRQQKTIGILPDQVPEGGNGCVYVNFFSEEAATMTLVSNLIRKTGAKAIGCFAKREANGEFTIVYRPADEGIYNEDETISAQAMNKTVESLIAIAPEQYQWIYKRFRYGRHGKRPIYKKEK